jgi:hypothetical protein
MNLTDGLTEHLRDVTPPHPDLDRVLDRGRRVQRRRRAAGIVVAAVALTATGAVGAGLLGSEGPTDVSVPPIASGGPMDFSEGLRAYADPGGELRMGGRSFPGDDLEWLDTDAATTPRGVVFFRDGRPFLLRQDGTARALWQDPVDDPEGWHPTAKVDARGGDVVSAVRRGDQVRLVVFDLQADDAVSIVLDCAAEAGCEGLVVDGVDSGTAFVRTEEGTFTWAYDAAAQDGLQPFAGPATRVADVRNRTVLHDGPRPTVTLEGWTYVAGAIDAQLTFDGRNVLYWSPVLEPATPGGARIRLDLPRSAQFFTVDTDGSVLAATTEDPARFFDCEVPSGACEPIGSLQMTGGDPMFIGNDM